MTQGGRPATGPGYRKGELTVHHVPSELQRTTTALRTAGRQIVLVPTMGALHEGHLRLVEMAKRVPGAVVVVSIFVNPLQFGEGEDLDAYPRTLDEDIEKLREAGVELVFAPTAAAMYPEGPRTTVEPGPLAAELEGAVRPGHFAGMLTVVCKLFMIARPHRSIFGEKDYQQLVLVRQMVADLNLDVAVSGVPTVRENDGLALSSRNRYLDEKQREQAMVLSAALVAGAHGAGTGPGEALAAARSVLAEEPALEVQYLELRSPDLGPAPDSGEARLLAAVSLGSVRLIDNVGVLIGE
ncbi:pantoate--beta-alanine ligase [Dietzia sp.]|uniref:pantoate--beta-alanine ligase n=1 Tax=Dietzia sp. TaxID=1871616 RepID=UPI002FD9FCD7